MNTVPASTLLRPLARTWLRRVQAELDTIPRPLDAPNQHTPGPEPDRVLLFGNGPAIGFGVRTHKLGLGGYLARGLSERTGRGTDLDTLVRRGLTIQNAAAALEGVRLWRYDAVVVTIGATDAFALLPPAAWRKALSRLLHDLRSASTPSTRIVLVGIHPLVRSALANGVVGGLADRHGDLLNRETMRLAEEDARIDFVELQDLTDAQTAEYRTAAGYRLLAERIAERLAPRLDVLARERPGLSARILRDLPDPEPERQGALDALGVLDTPSEERIDKIARMARLMFGTRFAAVSLIDRDRHWNKSMIGLDAREVPRDVSTCARTIEHSRALLVGDLWADDRAPEGTRRTPFRFYAGFPLESPDGYRVGTLCVLDSEPRSIDEVDPDALRTLALRVQEELWSEPRVQVEAEAVYAR